jgi:poly-gamma-glutamate synthesis protein (capsule biosynthesis protein)
VLLAGNVRFVNLANNHSLDFGPEGLHETIERLDAAGIVWAGAGRTASEALRLPILDVGLTRVGVIAFTNRVREFAAGRGKAGTNFLPVRMDRATLAAAELAIADLRRRGAHLVVASIHWGPNLRPWPTRTFRAFARAAVELGVDIVHGHSAHLVQGVERHRGGVILYDTGDFLDDYWIFPGIRTDRSAIFLVDVERHRPVGLRIVPVLLSPMRVNLAPPREFAAIGATLARRSRALGTSLGSTAEGLALALGTAPVPEAAAIPERPAALVIARA